MVDDFITRFVETSSQMLLGKGKTDSIGNTLTKRTCVRVTNIYIEYKSSNVLMRTKHITFGTKIRTGSDFNTSGLKILGVTRGFAPPLTELLQVLFLIYNSIHTNHIFEVD